MADTVSASTRVTVFMRHTPPLSKEQFHHARFEGAYLIDARGKKYPVQETIVGNAYEAGLIRRDFWMTLKSIPRSVDPLHLRASVSVNDCWPLKISVPVRARKP